MELRKNSQDGEKLGVVSTYFNPCNYLSRFINIDYFYESIKNYNNIELIIIEQYSDTSIYRINNIHERTYSFHSNEVYWMKEQLINKGLDILMNEKYKNLCWLDCDIKFENKNWVNEILNILKTESMCHVFRTCLKKKPNRKTSTSYSFTRYSENNKHDLDFLLKRKGEPGFGFAYRSDFINNSKMYQNAICGSGDFLNILGYSYSSDELKLKLTNDRFFRNESTEFLNDYIRWTNTIKLTTNLIKSANNTISVDYHGTIKNRNYVDREMILTRNKFNPHVDLTEYKNLYCITNDKIKDQIQNYFINRNEDNFIGDLNSNKHIKSKLLFIHRKRNRLYSSDNTIQDDISNLNSKYVDKKHKFMPIHLPKLPKCLLVSKVNDDLVKINKCNYDLIIVDKSTKKQRNVVHSDKKNKEPETYLNYIISNYNDLNEKLIFMSCDLYRESGTEGCDDLFKKINGFSFIDKTQIFKTDSDNHFIERLELNYKTRDYISNFKKSQFTYTDWVNFIIGYKLESRRVSTKTDNYHTHTVNETKLLYSPTNSFCVDRQTILNRPREFYINIYDNLQQHTWNEVMFYISGSWQLIFK